MGINVTLRTRPLGKDRLSLYLDFYPAVPNLKTGKLSRRQYLGLHIDLQPKTSLARTRNKDLMLIAEQIKIKRENELNKPEIYTEFEKSQLTQKAKGEEDFIVFSGRLPRRGGTTIIRNGFQRLIICKPTLEIICSLTKWMKAFATVSGISCWKPSA